MIEIFAKNTLRKFDVLEGTRQQLELLRTFLNNHYRGKSAVFDRDNGLGFRLEDGASLSPHQLSSGEQQMFVLAYQLLFVARRGTLLLIDEPEISLHVGWQNTFVDDIAHLGQGRGLAFLLATHSPTLIGGRSDLERPLDKLSE